ncbi:cell wall hydrolase [Lactobacillus pentosus]|uniref:SH3 domain-containing protein n=1 Tax=Lactiplantibacillus pentosus TaxID=1589 RepID=UPI00128B75DC|nr:SH3 domain-containing protein [Lactiplantibacillus pentosus]MPQ18834.1 cell wall hydrolase [Lactiplantibacillus pentosus]UXI96605.1 SH3 domain-containing protein [Lactiplantibacillus pentosus]
MKIGMTKKVVTSLLLSTALLPMLSGKADTTATATKPSSATKESGATSTASKQVTLSAGSQTDTAATSSETQSASTASQATESTTTTSAASKSDAAATSATSRVTVRAASAATSHSAKADSTDQQSSSSEAAKQDETAASATAASTTSAVDKLDETAKASAATSQDSQATSDHANSAVTSSAAKSAASADSAAKSAEAKSAESKSAETKPAAEQATPKATPQVETAKVAAAIQSPAVAARATRALTSQEIFLSQIKAGAVSGWNKYQVLPSVTAAQAILESGWGRSQLATAGNNLFGIKGSYQGQSIYFPTQEWNGSQYITIQDAFRKYPNWSASVEDHGAFLVENPRYSNLLGVTDYRRVASLLQQDGYATAPTYASSLISIIEYNQLHQWDQEVLNGQTNTGNNNNTQTLPDENVTVTSGTHKFTKTTTIHNSPDQNSASVGTYYAGETVNYNGKLTVNNATWLRYQSYSGVSRYVMISQATNNNNNHENQATVTPASGSYKFTVKTNIRSAASKSATVVGTYNAGETVYYNGKVTTGGTTWLRYLSYSGAQHYVATSGDEVAPVNKPNVVATSGAYRFTNTTAIKNAPANNAATVGTYNAGDTVYYNGKVTTNGETWLRYLSYSGAQHYVQISGNTGGNSVSKPQVTPQSGSYRFNQTTAIKNAPAGNAANVGTYNAGETVYYNAKVTADGQTWLRYLSYSGAQHYVAISGASSSSSNTTSTPTNTTGAFRFVTTTNIRTAPTTRAGIVGQYNPGETVYYNGTVQAEGYTWLRYLSRSGATHYVAMIKN